MKLFTIAALFALTLPLSAQVSVEKEAVNPSPNITIKGKLIQRQPIESAEISYEAVVFGDSKGPTVTLHLDQGNVETTAKTMDEAAQIVWKSLLKLETVVAVIKAEGKDLDLGAHKYASKVMPDGSRATVSVSPRSVYFTGKKTWIKIDLVEGKVKWRKGMVPNEKSRGFWDLIQWCWPEAKKQALAL